MRTTLFAALALATSLTLAPSAHSQCDDWRAVPEMARADIVRAATLWDPDGAGGPLPARLVIAGRFAIAGWPNGIDAASIASWDGAAWQPLGAGLAGNPTYSAANALTVYNGQLIAGGAFTAAGGATINGIARWNGSIWQPLGSGLSGIPPSSALLHVSSLVVYNSELIAAGGFVTAGGVTANGIARWNGSTWSALSGGTTGYISALMVYNTRLIACGTFASIGGVAANRIAAWNGSAWAPLGAGIDPIDTIDVSNSNAESLTVHNGELIVGGRFTGAGGVPASLVAAWNGSTWHALAAGLEDTFSAGFPTSHRRGVHALSVFNNQVVAAGRFTGSAGSTATDIASWNGSTWSALGSGLGGFPAAFADEGVYMLLPYDGHLFAGGIFPNNGSTAVQSLARWGGTAWVPTQGVLSSVTAPVLALQPWAGSVLVAGDYGSLYLQQELSYNISKWNGVSMTPGAIDPNGAVRVMAAFNRTPPTSSDLYIAGDFTTLYPPGSTGIAASRIATTNSTFGPGWQAMGAGFNGAVRAIERHNGSIYAAGDFTMSGTIPIARIARWTGAAWEQVGLGLNGSCLTLKSYNGFLYAGGTFTSAGASATGGLGRTDGTNWLTVGGSFPGAVLSLAIYNNELYIGGQFPGINGSPNVIKYNGSAYSSLGAGGTNGPVRAMTVSNNTLVIGGGFTTAFGLPASHLARWNGAIWTDIRGGTDINGTVYALTAYANELHVGGEFRTVKGGVIGSMAYARYLETGVPWIARHPASLHSACHGADASFQALAAVGYNGLTHTWRRNATPISNGATGTGSTIAGANSDTLTILNASELDNAQYDCIVSNSCGTVTCLPAALTVCYTNCDCSTSFPILNINDFTCFLNKFAANNPTANCDASSIAPVLNVNDFSCFLNKYAAGCP